jgi:DNA polymerase (family 10)
MDRHDLARIFNEIGTFLELQGENPFKSRAYYNAARTIENLNVELEELAREGRLGEIPGFGPAIIQKISEWFQTGTIAYYENLKRAIPSGLVELLGVPGLGPKKISQVHQTLGIASLEELEEACEANRLAGLPGFGAKTQEKIVAGIRFLKEHRGEYLLYEALAQGLALREQLAGHPLVERVELAGSCRRFKEIVKDLDLVAGTADPDAVIQFFQQLPEVAQVVASGSTKSTVVLHSGMNVDLRVVVPREFPHALQHFTGSKEHNTALRHLAKEQGYKVNEYGLFQADEPRYCRDEAALYEALGLRYIPPELRENLGELEAAAEGRLPRLVEAGDLRGLFHIHTTYSDGGNTLRELLLAAQERGYAYLGVSDHSQAAVYAHGLTREKLLLQWAEIDRLNEEFPGFRIFKGIEADILPSGELDYDRDLLSRFDFVIGSIHSQFRMSRAEMTGRLLKAMDNPFLTMLGHPTGRILLGRPGYEVDLEPIIAKAAERRIVIELNANPYRLDLDWRWCRRAKELGVMLAVNPDAHSVAELDLARRSLPLARKGWLEAKDLLNTRSTAKIVQYLAEKKPD